MTMLTDLHTHLLPARPGTALYNLRLPAGDIPSGQLCSVGLHPWHIDAEWEKNLLQVGRTAALAPVLAIGETGLDKLRGPSIELQEKVFKKQIELSERLHKPLVVHNVRCDSQILRIRRELSPNEAWVIHGFRGNRMQAASFLDHGVSLSFGLRFNPRALMLVGADRFLIETDEYPEITAVVNNISLVLNLPPAEVRIKAAANAARFLGIDFEP